MAETVNVPAVGKTNKTYVYAGGALLIGIVGYAWWKRRTATAVEPINPDALPEDRVPFTDAQVSSGESDSFTAGHPTTVSDWVQAATNRLLELGKDPLLVASALGKYITRQPLTLDEEDVVRSAIGQFGTPPGGDTYPILRQPAQPSTPTGGTTTTTRPKTAANATWIGHRVSAPVSLSYLASQFAASKTPTGILSTLHAIDARPENQTVFKRYGNNRPLATGSIVLVPTWK
jgi:hypothetical protein